MTRWNDFFNRWHSSARIHVEQALGILVSRWGIFWRPLNVKLGRAITVIMRCAKLYNYVLTSSEGSPSVAPQSDIDISGHTEAANYAVTLQDACDTELNMRRRRKDLEVFTICVQLTNGLQREKILQPSMY